MPQIFPIGKLSWGMVLWWGTPFGLFLTVQRWFDRTRTILPGYLAPGFSKWTRDYETVSTKFNWTPEVISWNRAWRQECTIVWFSNLEAKNLRWTH